MKTSHAFHYNVSNTDLAALDRFEGHPVHYQSIIVTVETGTGPVCADSYEVVHKTDGLSRSTHSEMGSTP